MRTEKIMKDGKELTTNDGKTLTENYFDVGDEVILDTGVVIERNNDVEVINKKGEKEKKIITNYFIKASVKDKDGKVFESTEEDPLFINLTPTQANSIKKLFSENKELNQEILKCYKYTNKYGDQVGIGLKLEFKKPTTFK